MTFKSPVRNSFVFAAILTLVVLSAGCGEEPAPTTTTTVSIDTMAVDDVLAAVGENVAAWSTAKFSLVDETESGAPFFGTTFQRMDAQVQTPNDFQMLVDVVAPAFGFVKVEVIKVGDEAVMKLFEGAPWSPMAPDEVPFNFGGLGTILAALPEAMVEAAVGGRETLQGVSTVRLEGEVPSETLAPLITSADSGHTVGLTLWIDDDFGLRQVRIAGRLYDEDAPETIRLLTINEVNIPVDIELP